MRAAAGAALLGALALAGVAQADEPTWALPEGRAFVEVARPLPDNLPSDHPAWPISARLAEPTGRYPHDVLGGIPGWGLLEVTGRACGDCRNHSDSYLVRLPEARVFEDVAPRLWDINGDGRPEIVVVESDAARGARLTVWDYPRAAGDALRMQAATPFIGRRFRWLAPVGAADFTGDGQAEIAYVETPHLGRVLRLVAMRGDALVEIAALPGVTNHRIGEPFISGGVRDCGTGPEIVAARGDWGALLAVRFVDGGLIPREIGARTDAVAFAAALDCRP